MERDDTERGRFQVLECDPGSIKSDRDEGQRALSKSSLKFTCLLYSLFCSLFLFVVVFIGGDLGVAQLVSLLLLYCCFLNLVLLRGHPTDKSSIYVNVLHL